MQTNRKSEHFMFKVALLSLSLMLTTSGAIAATVSLMQESFVDQSATAVEALVTASNFTVMIFVLLSSFFVRMIGTRKTVLLGLILSFLAGIFPVFSSSYSLIYISRLVLGAGFGLFNSLAVSLIGEYYEGEEKARLIGLQSAVQSAGQTAVTFLIGILMFSGWQIAFAANFVGIIPLVLYFIWGPRDDEPKLTDIVASEEEIGNKTKQSVNLPVILQAIALLISFAFLMVFFLKSSIFVAEENFANPSFIGIVMSIYTFVSIIANLFYSKLVKHTKHFSLPISYLFLGLGFIFLSQTTNFVTFTLIVVFLGFGGSLLLPYSWGLIMSKAPKGSINLAISIAMVGTNLGSFLAPYFGSLPAIMFGNERAAFAFIFAGTVMLVFAVIYLLIGKRLTLD
ncbi:MFS transporter [Enterococcus casseliflavus]|uniref:MFS transporter n=1 Tax=Enterococcus casseliflavus TaxID=37734 RepID=UPI0018833374|nr:MFS transporter [Enterococcus casseliflavus]MBE9908326.1 MFS transporter [Enterococcus casseliflavus]